MAGTSKIFSAKRCRTAGGQMTWLGKDIIDRLEAGARRLDADLDRRRLAREHFEPVPGGMAGQIDQNIDLIGPDQIAEFIIGNLRHGPPPVGRAPEISGELVLE